MRVLPLVMVGLTTVVACGAFIAAMPGLPPAPAPLWLKRVHRSSVAILALACSPYFLLASEPGVRWSTVLGVIAATLGPALFVVARLHWRCVLAVDERGLTYRAWGGPWQLAWCDIDAVCLDGSMPQLRLRERAGARTFWVSIPSALVDAVLLRLRREIPLQRVDPKLWDEATMAFVIASEAVSDRGPPLPRARRSP